HSIIQRDFGNTTLEYLGNTRRIVQGIDPATGECKIRTVPHLDIRSTPEQPGIKLILGEEKPKEPPFRSVLRLANDWASLRAANYRRRTAQLWFHSLLFAGNSRTWFEPGFNSSSVFSRPRPRLFSIAVGRLSR